MALFTRRQQRQPKAASLLRDLNKWQLLYSTTVYTTAAIMQGKLEENSIPVMVLNRQDSMYIIGEIEVYVPGHLVTIALSIIHETLTN